MALRNNVAVVLGAQWGDEGKGKLVDCIAGDYDLCARCAGGNNAGHTIVTGGVKYDFHLIPSGLINQGCKALIGSGVVIHLPSFFEELDNLERKGLHCKDRLFVSDRAQLVFDFHQIVDGLKEVELGGSSIGTTKKGIGPAYSSKASRSGLRVHHLYESAGHDTPNGFAHKFRKLVDGRFKRYGHFDYDTEKELERYKSLAERFRPFVVDGVAFVHEYLSSGRKVLVEGANALMLDIDFGTYPFVTSSSTTVGGVCTGLGIPTTRIGQIFGVVKAYTTRVGAGPFPTEQLNDVGSHMQEVGAEFGTTTGRRRRCGWLDLVVMKYSTLINGYTSLNLTKLDVLSSLKEIKVATAYLVRDQKMTPVIQNTAPASAVRNGTDDPDRTATVASGTVESEAGYVALPSFPADLTLLESSGFKVKYTTLPGWESDISQCSRWEDLPAPARAYVEFIEHFLQVPIEWIGVGPSRQAMIHRRAPV